MVTIFRFFFYLVLFSFALLSSKPQVFERLISFGPLLVVCALECYYGCIIFVMVICNYNLFVIEGCFNFGRILVLLGDNCEIRNPLVV